MVLIACCKNINNNSDKGKYLNFSRNYHTETQAHKQAHKHRFLDLCPPLWVSVKAARESVITGLLSFWRDNYKSWESYSPQMITGRERERERDEKRRIETKIPDIEPIHFFKMPLRGYSRELESEARAIPTRRERESERQIWRDRGIKWQADKAAIQTFPFPPSFEHRNRSI